MENVLWWVVLAYGQGKGLKKMHESLNGRCVCVCGITGFCSRISSRVDSILLKNMNYALNRYLLVNRAH